MLDRLKSAFDPYILALLSTVAFASVLPARGMGANLFDHAADAAIVLLFFLHGAKLSREAIVAGAGHWRLHLATMGTTFALFPLLGLGLAAIPGLPALVASGMLFLTLLPSTVQSSIAFTSIARGNVAAAVCSASFSNLAGIFITPLLASLLMGGSGASMSWGSIEKIVLQLLLPFALGHGLRPVIGKFVSRHKAMIGYVDRGSILLVVYTAFSAAVVEGLWTHLPLWELGLIAGLSAMLLAVVLAATWGLGAMLGFERADRIVLLFCGSKKSLASGVPIAGVLFPAAQVGVVILPLMLFHQIQLMACAVIARALAQDEKQESV
ncbi:bile acid:sodium symporter family protein [Novosphingobium sp. SG707]|uniref:bile acid:sodium symporter family protein n=2 Tax=Novosphingobium TaxID=165696 RepID=UPI00144523F3|nr:bile acid:sodium symporter family protein [Novosphingobium sp. SG707]NKJ01063.1 sodium/bile acid cotransporter 7 [Novosphingobium sp. SG707]